MQTKVRCLVVKAERIHLTTAGKALHIVVLLFASKQNVSTSFWMRRVARMMVMLIFLAFSFLSLSQYICITLYPNLPLPRHLPFKQSLLCCFAFKLPQNCSRSSNLRIIIIEKWSNAICQVCKLLDCNCSYFLEVAELLMHCYV